MIWMYTAREKEFVAEDVDSLKQLTDVAGKQWVWVDIYDPNEKEREIISELLGNKPEIVENIKKRMEEPLDIHIEGFMLCDYEKIHDYVLLTIPSISLKEQLRVFPVVFMEKKNMVITWGEEDSHTHSKIIKTTIKRLREGVEEGQELNSSLVISVLFHEIAIRNSNVLFSVRERIDQMEEQTLESGGKHLIRSVFSLKKMISALYRLMIDEREFMLDATKSVIPRIKLDETSKSIVEEAISIIDRELDFMDSYNRTLDSILTLQDLASIHKVESSINYLTIVLVVGTAILIILELLARFNPH
ncbi:MAG: magnesium transporter CorA family protein [Candidatus Bathyarchaeum sp.]|nr:MAG: magnesium transporter CorA family protein [Candidatus Bathyarchaeum sp.]